ncbi:MAG: hypothetical protein ACYS8W_21415 [Planctomycetota bacterium]
MHKTIEGAPVWKKETKDEYLPPPDALITLGDLPFPPEMITISDNSITLDLKEQVRGSHSEPWVVRISSPNIGEDFIYTPSREELEIFEFKFGLVNVIATSADADKMRRFAGRALDGEKPELAMMLLERAVRFEKDTNRLIDIAMMSAPHCASIVLKAAEKTALDIPDSTEADTLLILGGALCDSKAYEIGGDLLDIIEDRDPLSEVTIRAILHSAKNDMLRAITYVHTLNRLAKPDEKPGDIFLLGYSTMKLYANIDIKLSILKEPPPEAAKKWGEALELFKAGEFENAAEAFGRILIGGKYPREVANNRAICYWRMAEAAFAAKDFDAARLHVRRMVETCPVLPELDNTLSTFFTATAIAELAAREPDLRSALRDLRASVRLELRRDALAALVTALWRARKIKAAGAWARTCASFDITNPFLLSLASFMEKVSAKDFPAAEKALDKLRGIPAEGNEAALVDMFRHELEWEKYIAEQREKGKSYKEIISEVKKYRTSSDAYRKDAGRLKGALPESK